MSLKSLYAGAGAVVACVGALSSQSAPPIPVDQEPRHRVMLADDRLRVLEVSIPAGDTSLNHQHDFDLVTINIENGPTRTFSSPDGWSAVRPREVGGVNVAEYTGRSSAHVVQNVGDRAYRLTGVENLKTGEWSSHAAIAEPGVRVITESRAFRAYQVDLIRDRRATHVHQVPVVVTLLEGRAMEGRAEGRPLERPGEWRVVPAGVVHELATDTGARIIEIEVR
jgi:quercetin dioxygenase-like cupin family protein